MATRATNTQENKRGNMKSIIENTITLVKRATLAQCLVFALFACPLITLPVVAQTTDQPPLIDRDLFFGDPEISGAQLSPDGKFIAFVKPFKGNRNIWVKRTDVHF